ncbi:MAG: hypothetical protein WBA13_18280 [Microcoleaceae cyanobacterium]
MLTTFKTDQIVALDTDQIFPLIDSILPFEVCLHYQVLPLSLKNQAFFLGVVDPDDQTALDYIHRIVTSMNCNCVTQVISAVEQRSILSAYLYHTQKSQTPANNDANNSESDSTLLSVSSETEIANTLLNPTPNIPPLKINAQYLDQPLEFLEHLPPVDFVQELLGRVFQDGIGRLYFEAHSGQGRILWSQDGVLQSVVEAIEPRNFQAILKELKQLVGMSLTPVQRKARAEVERTYQGTHLMLRLQITRGNHGEEANFQVLRGAALKFYQQQQLSKLSLDAVQIAEKLRKHLNQIRDRMVETPLSSDQAPLLNNMLENIIREAQLLLDRQHEQS